MAQDLVHTLLSSVGEILEHRCRCSPSTTVYTYLDAKGDESLITFAELDEAARRIAAELIERRAVAEPVLMLYPSGLDFIKAFIGCLYAGSIAVPAYPPRRNRSMDRITSIVESCKARIVMTTSEVARQIRHRFAEEAVLAGPEILATDGPSAEPTSDRLSASLAARVDESLARVGRGDTAFLQYTSGSTSEPKGVIVSHDNLLYNLEMVRQVNLYQTGDVLVSWLPFFHDMGLIGYILETLYLGGHCVLMEPSTFARRPIRWLRAVSRFGAVASGGPNFGYDLCLAIEETELEGLDLSQWKIAHNAAEPIRSETLRAFSKKMEPYGFSADAFFPAYGLAEATVFVSGTARKPPVVLEVDGEALAKGMIEPAGPSSGSRQTFVGCGTTDWLDQDVRIVDPESMAELGAYRVGEVWASGSNIASGYWGLESESERAFGATLRNAGARQYLRTGDLGFMDDAGQLFITGRIKDLLIFHGLNHYPQDIELTIELACPELVRNSTIAFSIPGPKGIPRLCVAAEVERTQLRKLDFEMVGRKLCLAIAEGHDLGLHELIFLKPHSNPKTSSGKVQRDLCRRLYQQGELRSVARWPQRSRTEQAQGS